MDKGGYTVMEITADGASYFYNDRKPGDLKTVRVWESKEEAVAFANDRQQQATARGWRTYYAVDTNSYPVREVYRTR